MYTGIATNTTLCMPNSLYEMDKELYKAVVFWKEARRAAIAAPNAVNFARLAEAEDALMQTTLVVRK